MNTCTHFSPMTTYSPASVAYDRHNTTLFGALDPLTCARSSTWLNNRIVRIFSASRTRCQRHAGMSHKHRHHSPSTKLTPSRWREALCIRFFFLQSGACRIHHPLRRLYACVCVFVCLGSPVRIYWMRHMHVSWFAHYGYWMCNWVWKNIYGISHHHKNKMFHSLCAFTQKFIIIIISQ